jgi:hypothetical protein
VALARRSRVDVRLVACGAMAESEAVRTMIRCERIYLRRRVTPTHTRAPRCASRALDCLLVYLHCVKKASIPIRVARVVDRTTLSSHSAALHGSQIATGPHAGNTQHATRRARSGDDTSRSQQSRHRPTSHTKHKRNTAPRRRGYRCGCAGRTQRPPGEAEPKPHVQ